MGNNNFWGDPDDIEPLPDWMNPETYKNGSAKVRGATPLNEEIQRALKQPPIDLSYLNNTKL
jgi:hypothetical protein